MKTMILAVAIAAISASAYAGRLNDVPPPTTETTSATRCWNTWRGINCESQTVSPYATTTTQCIFRDSGGSGCATERAEKPRPKPPEPPRPVKAPTTDIGIGGVRIMRGMPQ